jgi:uncharacterized protein YneF (UPF0154 family)
VIAVWLALALLAGLACGFVIGCRQLDRMIARMSPDQVDALADRVWELNHGAE